MRILRAGLALLLVAAAAVLAGCSGGFGGPKRPATPVVPVDPNLYPSNYRVQLVRLLLTMLTDRADYTNAFISQPVLKQVTDSQHYVVCVQFTNHSPPKAKVAIFLAGVVTQFVDATPELCGDAAYQPFPELASLLPPH